MILKNIVLVFIAIQIIGCISYTKPFNNKEFAYVNELKKYEGTYTNRGEPNDFLSEIFWSSNSEFWESSFVKKIRERLPNRLVTADSWHEYLRTVYGSVKYIQVNVDNNKVTIKAINKNKCYFFKKTYIENIDFTIKDGKVIINQPEGNNIVVGLNQNVRTLGLDTEGNGKFKQSGYSVGLALMVIPVAIGGGKEIRFKKLKKLYSSNECK